MKCVYITENELCVAEADGLKDFYRLIGCDCVDIAVRSVMGHVLNFVVDDEGLLVDRPQVRASNVEMTDILAGNLLVFGMDEESGDLTDIHIDEVAAIMWSTVLTRDERPLLLLD